MRWCSSLRRVCIVCVSLRAGGTERVVTRVAEYLSARHEVTLVLLSRRKPFYLLRSDIQVLYPGFDSRQATGWRWYPKILRYLWRNLREVRPDLVLCFGEPIAPPTLLISTLVGCRCIVFNRASPLASLKGLRGIANPLTYPLAQKVVVQTRRSIDMLQGRYRFVKFAVWPNPIDVPIQVKPFGNRARRIITVGTLGGRKNQQAMIRAFSALPERAGWTLDLIGDGPDKATLERLARDLDVTDHVRFLGECKDVEKLLQDSRIFAFASLTEGFPNALAEALAAGCACISFDCPTGPSELIEHNVNGLLIEAGDQERFSAELARLIADAALQERLSVAARRDIERFSADRVLEQFEKLLRSAFPQVGKRQEAPCD